MSTWKKIPLLALVAAFAASAWGQAPAAGAAAGAAAGGAAIPQGFTVQALIAELSLFLPPELLRPAGGGAWAGGGGGSGGPSSAGSVQGGGAGQGRPQIQFKGDPRLYLTREQVDRLEPIAAGLKDNPMPSPTKARQLRGDLDAILSPAQKAEFADFQKAVEKFRADMQKRRAASGAAPAPDFGGTTDQQRPQNRPAGQGPAGQGLSQLQRRQRMVELFIKALGEYRKSLG